MLTPWNCSHFWKDSLMVSAPAGWDSVCNAICFLRGTFPGRDFHFSPVGVMWLTASPVQLCYMLMRKYSTWAKRSNNTIGENSKSQTSMFDVMDHVPLAIFTFVVVLFCTVQIQEVKGHGFHWIWETRASFIQNTYISKLTVFKQSNFDYRLVWRWGCRLKLTEYPLSHLFFPNMWLDFWNPWRFSLEPVFCFVHFGLLLKDRCASWQENLKNEC